MAEIGSRINRVLTVVYSRRDRRGTGSKGRIRAPEEWEKAYLFSLLTRPLRSYAPEFPPLTLATRVK